MRLFSGSGISDLNMATEKELRYFYQVNMKLIGESWEDFYAEHHLQYDFTIEEIQAKYDKLVALGKELNNAVS